MHAALASAISGALYFLGYLGFGYAPLLCFFLIPLWWALERSDGTARGFGLGCLFGAVAYLGGHDWLLVLLDVFLAEERALGLALFVGYGLWFSLLFGLYGAGFHALRKRGVGLLSAAIPLWIVLEWVVPLLFPVYAGAGLIDALPLVQIADLGGPLLLSAQLLAINAGVWFAVSGAGLGGSARLMRIGGVVVLLVASLLYGFVQQQRYGVRESGLEVGLVQANLGVLEKRNQAERSHRKHVEMSRTLLAAQPSLELLIWPETAYMRAITGPLPVSGLLIRSRLDVPLLFGAPLLDASEKRRIGAERVEAAQHNAALMMDERGMIASAYRKNLLVPFAEQVPFASWWAEEEAAPAHAQTFASSDALVALTLGEFRIATPICYEAVRPDFVRRLVVESGANLIVTLANDAWFGDSREPRLHLQLARLRAIELRRDLVRATNSGISAFVDAYGRVNARTGLLEEATLTGIVAAEQSISVYARAGDWPGPVALAWLVGAFAWTRTCPRRTRAAPITPSTETRVPQHEDDPHER